MHKYFTTKLSFSLILFLVHSIAVFLFLGCQTKQTVNGQENKVPEGVEYDRPQGVMAYPDTIRYELPDEYILLIFLRGDEHSHIVKTVDGYLLQMNDEGFYEYAMKDKDGNLISTGITARNSEDRTEEVKRFLESLLDKKPVSD